MAKGKEKWFGSGGDGLTKDTADSMVNDAVQAISGDGFARSSENFGDRKTTPHDGESENFAGDPKYDHQAGNDIYGAEDADVREAWNKDDGKLPPVYRG